MSRGHDSLMETPAGTLSFPQPPVKWCVRATAAPGCQEVLTLMSSLASCIGLVGRVRATNGPTPTSQDAQSFYGTSARQKKNWTASIYILVLL